ncbi:MAG: 2-oxoacid:acceptor oxidoreductase family protein, partial [Actinomycetota bacterium]
MQLTGDRFTSASALAGNDLATLPEFPAEIRAPQGTLAGVSAFQVHISDHDIHTPGDEPDVLVAMNPAALKSELDRLRSGGTLILNDDAFDERNLEKAGFETDPREDNSLAGYTVHRVAMTKLTLDATAELDVKKRDAERSKNFSWIQSSVGSRGREYIQEMRPRAKKFLERSASRFFTSSSAVASRVSLVMATRCT